jgi:glycosyltransferase involved in cell wall biosynthesis
MNNMNPNVSIVVTNYNYGKYLPRCLRSVLSQKYIKTEVIVVDDGSTDDTIERITPFLDDIKFIKTPTNLGVAGASNLGLKHAKGQYFIRVDADDFVNTNMCYFMKEYLEANNDAFCVSCDYTLVDNFENVLERKYARVDNISCGIMYRKDLLYDLGGYNDNMRHREEEELRKRLGDTYKIHHLEMPFYRYRMHNYNKTKSPEYKTTKI